MSFIEVTDIAVSYDGFPVLQHVNLDVAEGAFITIVGASGYGKSTFLRLLLSQEEPTAGAIRIAGVHLPPRPTPDRGIVFQRYSVFPHLTVADNLILPMEFERSAGLGRVFGARRRGLRSEAGDILERIGLAPARDRYPAQLSGGMQQRLAIAQALVKKPRLLLLDEPFGALDPGIRRDMHDLLLGLWEETGMTVFMVTHDIAEAFKLGTRLIVFDKVRHEPDDPDAAGATITYDLPLRRPNAAADDLASASVLAANALDASISVLSKETSTESGEKH
jgi:NitT/TauT family transport system ATP-binding protein